MSRHVLNLGLRLLLVCTVAAIGLGFTYTLVEKRIAEQELKQRAEAAEVVLAPIGAQPMEETELATSLQAEFPDLIGVFEGLDESGNTIGYAFVVKSKGYNFITMAVGIDANGQVTGIDVVTNEETPGVGGKVVEDPAFLDQFNGKGPDTLSLGEDIDAATGATFTSTGITDGVNMALSIWVYLQENP